VGQFLAAVAAGPVYRLLGAKDLGVAELPPLDTPVVSGSLGWHYHTGGHTATPADWAAFLQFLGSHFNGATASSPPAQAPSAAASTPALPDPKSTVVPRLEGQVTINGVLDEQVWEKATRLGPFVKHDTMGAARVATEVRIWHDQAALYLGWTCEDADIQATFTERDSRFWEEEVVEFFVTPGALDRYFELQWNPLGGTFDAIISNEIGADGRSQQFKGDWSYTAKNMTFAVKADGSVQNSSDRDRRWTVEVRIPFADLNVKTPAAGDVWGANFYRFNRDQGADAEQLSWSPTIWPGFHQPNRFGYLRFAGESKP
jgi:hypothetical protein